jgi:deoxyribose-phosphate aldolase
MVPNMGVRTEPLTLPTVPQLAAMIDHAVLKPTQTERDVVDACTLARREHIATVCVKPFYVSDCARLLKGSAVGTSTVIGFPHGGQAPEVKVTTALTALRDGATELDMVINIGALIERDYATIEKEIASVVGVGHASEATVKVILELAYLDDAQKAIAAQIAVASGADFVKTSTGFGP